MHSKMSGAGVVNSCEAFVANSSRIEASGIGTILHIREERIPTSIYYAYRRKKATELTGIVIVRNDDIHNCVSSK